MMNLSDEETISFIDMYHDRSFLWDSTDSQYKNKNKRHAGLMEIAEIFSTGKFEVEKKIKNLQSQFSRERKKENESKWDKTYISKWFAYKSMMFLADRKKPKNTQDTEAAKEQYDLFSKSLTHFPGSHDREDEEKREENIGKENVSQVDTSNTENNEATTSTPHKKTSLNSLKQLVKKRKFSSISAANKPIIKEVVHLLKSIQSMKKDKDEYDLFGEQVAIKLRKITSPQAKFIAQQIINKTLFEAEMGVVGD